MGKSTSMRYNIDLMIAILYSISIKSITSLNIYLNFYECKPENYIFIDAFSNLLL